MACNRYSEIGRKGLDMIDPKKYNAEMRKHAEEIDQERHPASPENTEALSPGETQQVLHELRVHQIELEMQNEQLRTSQVQLETARARYFDLYDLAPAGYCTVSEKGLVLEANLTAAILLDVPRGFLLRRPFSQFILKEDADIYYLHHKQLLKSAEPQSFDLRMLKKDGTAFWANLAATVALDADGTTILRVVMSDITERKRMEEKLLFLSKAVESASDAIGISDAQGHHIYQNKALSDLFEYATAEEMEADGGGQRVVKNPDVAREMYGSIMVGKPWSGELEMVTKSGRVFLAYERADAIRDRSGNILGLIGIITDITRRKRFEMEKAALENQNRQLQKAESLDRMAGSIAHLFNNQLHVVLGYLNMVIGELPPGDSRVEKLTTAMQAARKASDVSLLMITCLGKKPGKIASIDLSELCHANLPILQAGKPEDVVLKTDLPSPGPGISADVKQIQQLLTNIVINAWEAIGDGAGTIHLNVRTVSPADIPTSHRFPVDCQFQNQNYACLEVIDSGCGIKEVDIDRLFDPFFSTKFIGRGLGLSVVLGIVRAHNAVITVKNRIGGGVVFSVFFSLSAQAVSQQIDQVAKAPEIVPGGTVLLVEDNEEVRKMTTRMLISLGFTVLQARDGVEAVEIFGQHKDEISCLLSDLTMPRMGGWETIAAVRAIRHDLPVILASGYDEASVMAGEHSEMPDFFLNKPYDFHKLGDMIGQAIARKKERT